MAKKKKTMAKERKVATKRTNKKSSKLLSKFYALPKITQMLLFITLFTVVGAVVIKSFAAPRNQQSSGMSITYEAVESIGLYPPNTANTICSGGTCSSENTNTEPCVGEDSIYKYNLSGSLAPGESYTFTTKWGDCSNQRAIVIKLVQSKQRTLSPGLVLTSATSAPSISPGNDAGTPIQAKQAPDGGSLALCMFQYLPVTQPYTPAHYSFTIKNTGSRVAKNIYLSGTDDNDWPTNFYTGCQNADADNDGWSDAVEHTMLLNTALTGTDYLKARSATSAADDEFDANPADFNDDGIVTQTDVDAVQAHLGLGDGSDKTYWGQQAGTCCNHQSWARWDLDNDSYVTSKDVDIVKSLLGTTGSR